MSADPDTKAADSEKAQPTEIVFDEKAILASIDTAGLGELARSAFEDEQSLPPVIPCIPLPPSSKSTPNIEKLRELLGRRLQVEVVDGRKFIGTACCFDNQRNIVMNMCIEHRKTKISDGIKWKVNVAISHHTARDEYREDTRQLGLVLIPGKHIIRVFVAERTQ